MMSRALPNVPLGRGGPAVPVLGLGCMAMTGSYGARDAGEALRTIHHAVDRGVTLIDTADMYGWGANEELVGRALAARPGLRQRVQIATKFGFVKPEGGGDIRGIDGRPERVPLALEASLRRLGTDVVDLWYLHRLDPDVPVEETVGAMADEVRKGRVKQIGLSEVSPATLRKAADIHPIAAVQSEFSLVSREPENGLLAACAETGTSFVAYGALGRGLLAGSVGGGGLAADDGRKIYPRFAPENLARNADLAGRLAALAAERNTTPAALALAWVLAAGTDAAPVIALFGASRPSRVDDNLAALALQLTAEDRATIGAALPAEAVAGDRYAPDRMAAIDR